VDLSDILFDNTRLNFVPVPPPLAYSAAYLLSLVQDPLPASTARKALQGAHVAATPTKKINCSPAFT